MRYLRRLKILLGRPRSRVPLGRRAASRAAKNCCLNPTLSRAHTSNLNLGCPISKSDHRHRCPYSHHIQHVSAQGIWRVGVDGQQDVPSPQDINPQSLWKIPHRYASKTICNVMEGNDDTNNATVRTITQTAAVTAAGTMATVAGMSGITSNAYNLTINADIAAAINQLLANQTTIMTQMVALSFAQEPAQHTRWFVGCKVCFPGATYPTTCHPNAASSVSGRHIPWGSWSPSGWVHLGMGTWRTGSYPVWQLHAQCMGHDSNTQPHCPFWQGQHSASTWTGRGATGAKFWFLQFIQMVEKLERLFFVWLWHWSWTHVPHVPI